MSNKILNFDDFHKGSNLSDPKKHATPSKPDQVKKEKTIDQVKHADLAQVKVTEPDYTKVAKTPIQESSADTQAEIDAINQTKELRKQLATVENDVEKLAILNRIKQIQQQVEQKAKASKSI